MEQATREGTGTMSTIVEVRNGTITIETIETGEFWFLAEWDNGEYPNSPYIETYEREDGPFETAEDAEYEARAFLNYEDWSN